MWLPVQVSQQEVLSNGHCLYIWLNILDLDSGKILLQQCKHIVHFCFPQYYNMFVICLMMHVLWLYVIAFITVKLWMNSETWALPVAHVADNNGKTCRWSKTEREQRMGWRLIIFIVYFLFLGFVIVSCLPVSCPPCHCPVIVETFERSSVCAATMHYAVTLDALFSVVCRHFLQMLVQQVMPCFVLNLDCLTWMQAFSNNYTNSLIPCTSATKLTFNFQWM